MLGLFLWKIKAQKTIPQVLSHSFPNCNRNVSHFSLLRIQLAALTLQGNSCSSLGQFWVIFSKRDGSIMTWLHTKYFRGKFRQRVKNHVTPGLTFFRRLADLLHFWVNCQASCPTGSKRARRGTLLSSQYPPEKPCCPFVLFLYRIAMKSHAMIWWAKKNHIVLI